MARIEPLPMREIVDEEILHACEDAERQTGISTSPRTYAKNPAAFKALGAFRAALAKESTLDPVLRELVRLKIAGLNRCRYWLSVRYAGARHAGLTEDKVAAINDESSNLLSPRERTAVRYAEKLAVDHHKVDDAQWTELRRHFSEADIIELTMHTTLYIGLGRFNEVIGLDPA